MYRKEQRVAALGEVMKCSCAALMFNLLSFFLCVTIKQEAALPCRIVNGSCGLYRLQAFQNLFSRRYVDL